MNKKNISLISLLALVTVMFANSSMLFAKTVEQKEVELRKNLTQKISPDTSNLDSQNKAKNKASTRRNIFKDDFEDWNKFSNNIQLSILVASYATADKMLFYRTSKFTEKSIFGVPGWFDLNLILDKKVRLALQIATPYAGALTPGFVVLNTKIEVGYIAIDKFFLGIGFIHRMGNINGIKVPGRNTVFLNNRNVYLVRDLKMGLTFGVKFLGGMVDVGIYPRHFFPDKKSLDKQDTAYDFSHFYFNIKTSLAAKDQSKYAHFVQMFINMLYDEDFLTEYNVPSGGNYSHYFGKSSLQLGFEFYNLSKKEKVKVSAGFYTGINFYFLDLQNPNIVSIGKGQGLLGADFDSGKLKGFRTASQTFTVFSKQSLLGGYFFEEEFALEVFYKQNIDYNVGFHLKAKAGFYF